MNAYKLFILDDEDGVSKISFVTDPANGQPVHIINRGDGCVFAIGIALVPDQKIIRKSESKGVHYISFSSDVIRRASSLYMIGSKCLNFDIEHSGAVNGVAACESFILGLNSSPDIRDLFPNAPDGSWVLVFRIENNNLIKAIDNGVIKGISIDGVFCYESDFEEEIRSIYRDLLKLK